MAIVVQFGRCFREGGWVEGSKKIGGFFAGIGTSAIQFGWAGAKMGRMGAEIGRLVRASRAMSRRFLLVCNCTQGIPGGACHWARGHRKIIMVPTHIDSSAILLHPW